MKKIIYLLIFPMLLSISGSVRAQVKNQDTLKTVSSVDLKQYSGKWFEIARYPNKFQKDCVGNVTANYTLKTADSIEVLNQCVKKNGTIESATGKAQIDDKTTNAKLKVRFAPAVLSFIPGIWGDYWIIDLDDKYQYAVVGDPKRKYLWILSRTPEMSDAAYQNILRNVETLGYNPGKLVKTSQKVEIIKGAAIDKQ